MNTSKAEQCPTQVPIECFSFGPTGPKMQIFLGPKNFSLKIRFKAKIVLLQTTEFEIQREHTFLTSIKLHFNT